MKKTEWDIEIASETSWFSFKLNEIWRYRDLVALLVKRDYIAKYKQTILGPLWHIIQPLLTTAMSFLLFNVVANIDTEGKNAILFQLAGITIWSYFATCLTSTANTFIANAGIFGKVYFPRMVMPVSVVISSFLQMAIQFVVLIAAIIVNIFINTEYHLSWNILLLPIVVTIMALLALGLGIIVSSLTTKYRDLAVLVTFGVQLLMFASAVNYPISTIANRLGTDSMIYKLVAYNPLSILVDTFRNIMLGGPIQYGMLAYTAGITVVVLMFGIMLFNKVEKSFMDTV
ncbi:ABC transporter permease [Polluticaenibacter yanchengensis]|uniref:Transport permease protein n=1 Tax=Polluticaenibacter yanchengensis TaxID=3014562 RepID=A0ABT4UIL1_9BACT|nr:ABC transporter permease [Chitinophagaceae bacterium LY-5]